MNQRLFTLLEVALLGGLVVFVLYIGGAFTARDPAPTLLPTATPTPVRTAKPAPTRGSPGPSAVPSPTPTTPALTQPTGLIAFESNRDGNSEIYVMDVETGIPTNLTNNPADDYAPLWSPDGSRLAFFSTRTGWLEIYAMNADGSNVKQLTNTRGTNTAYSQPFSWSPDGKQILAIRDWVWGVGQQPKTGSLDSIQTNGSGFTTLYHNPNAVLSQPGWSPNGNYVAVMLNSSSLHLGKTNETPFALYHFTDSPCYNYIWAPDGGLSCFAQSKLTTFNLNDSDIMSVVYFSSSNYPSKAIWSPDRKLLLYIVDFFNPFGLRFYLVTTDNSDRREILIEGELVEYSVPSWSPDSQWIAFSSKKSDYFDINVVNVYDPFQYVQLTINVGDNFSPQWQPRPEGTP